MVRPAFRFAFPLTAGFLSVGAAALAAALLLARPTAAEDAQQDVDVALAMGVDISYSMDDDEQRLQREGYIQTLGSRQLLDGVAGGLNGRIAVAYFEWAGNYERRVLVPWTIVDGPKTMEPVLDILRNTPRRRASRTSVSGAIDFGADLLDKAPVRAIRKVLDISGDGPNNNGRPVEQARDEASGRGSSSTDCPILVKRSFNNSFDIENLDEYYSDCVVGGPGSFMIEIDDREDHFAQATRQKLLKEIAGIVETPRVLRVADRPKVDCLVGEKLWQQRFGSYGRD